MVFVLYPSKAVDVYFKRLYTQYFADENSNLRLI